jgi:hypothetical protein
MKKEVDAAVDFLHSFFANKLEEKKVKYFLSNIIYIVNFLLSIYKSFIGFRICDLY